jgi:TM2 domain-containing membrane protein YozV
MAFCRHCGKDFSFGHVTYCPTCGKPGKGVADITSPINTKNPVNTLMIAILAGAIAFNGIGHLYIGKISKGIKYLVVGWILGAIAFLFPYLGIIYFVFWIWQAYDAYRRAKHYNESFAKNDKEHW